MPLMTHDIGPGEGPQGLQGAQHDMLVVVVVVVVVVVE